MNREQIGRAFESAYANRLPDSRVPRAFSLLEFMMVCVLLCEGSEFFRFRASPSSPDIITWWN